MSDENNEEQYSFKHDKYTSITPSSIYAGEDDLANKAGLVISFHHVPSGKFVFFKAFITAFTDTYAPDWSAETVYGRADPIYVFKNTTRKISLSFKVPAISAGEAYENLAKVQKLVQFLYPTYTDVNNAATIAQSPLVRLKVMNLAQETSTITTITQLDEIPVPTTAEELAAAEAELAKITTETGGYSNYTSTTDSSRGLLGVINNVTVDHNLANSEAGVIEKGNNTILPKLIEINLDFSPIHEHPVGWHEGTTVDDDMNDVSTGELVFASPGFPYMGDELNITMGPKPAVGGTATTLGEEALEIDKSNEEISNDIAADEPATNEDAGEENAEAAFGGWDMSAREIRRALKKAGA